MMLSSSLPRVSTYESDIADSWPEQADGKVYDAPEDFYEPEKPVWKKSMKPEASYATEDKMRRLSDQTKLKNPLKIDSKISHPDDHLNALLKVGAEAELVIYHYWLCSKVQVNLLLCVCQEEEDLVNAHRKQVEDTMDIVREVCNTRLCFQHGEYYLMLAPCILYLSL